jgi:membrane protease YdiL (CAAX protease family)
MQDHPSSTGPRGFWGAAPVRFLVMGVVLLLAYVGPQVAAQVQAGHAAAALRPAMTLAGAAVGGLLTVGLYICLVRLMERRAASELAPGPGVGLVVIGLIMGVLLFCAVYAVFFWQGLARSLSMGGVADIGRVFAVSVVAGVAEELIFRGVVFRIVEESCGTLVALVVSAAVFGLLHAGNPGATLESTAAIALEAGVLLAACYVLCRNLWFPIGVHIGWNFTEGGVFGTAVSGHTVHGLLNAPLQGPANLTGGAFGPEASPAAIGVCLLAAVVLLVIAVRAGQWRRMTLRLYPR